jgi:ABC-type molybdate transport system permease subunit
VFGTPPCFSFAALVIGSMVYSLPFALQPILSAFRRIDAATRPPSIIASALSQSRETI